MLAASSKSVSVGCSKQGYIGGLLVSLPEESMSLTVVVAGEMQPEVSVPFSAANKLLVAVGAEVPEKMN
jgi:hypothetical protein